MKPLKIPKRKKKITEIKAAASVLTGLFPLPLVDVAVGVGVGRDAQDAVDGVGSLALQGGLVGRGRGVRDHRRRLGHRGQRAGHRVLGFLRRLVAHDSGGGKGGGVS